MASSARIDELRKKFDENPRRYFAPLANEFRKAGDLEQAVFICQEYLPQQPGHMSGHIVYGQALFELGRDEEAKAVFETALSLDPENLIALRHLGDIARQAGDLDVARFWYQRVLESDPRNEEIAQILVSLGETRGEAAPPSVQAQTAAAGEQIATAPQETDVPPAPPSPLAETNAVPEPVTASTPSSDSESYEPFEGFDRTIDFDQAADEPTADLETPLAAEPAAAETSAVEARAEEHPLENAHPLQPDAEDLLDIDDFSIGGESLETAAVELERTPETFDSSSTAIPGIEFSDGEEQSEALEIPEQPGEPASATASLENVGVEDSPVGITEASDVVELEPAEHQAAPEGAFLPESEPEPAIELATDIELGLPPDEPAPAEFRPEPEAAPEPRPDSADEVFVTETMANLFVQQGHLANALEIYEKLAASNPGDTGIQDRIRDVKERIYGRSRESVWEPEATPADFSSTTAAAAPEPSIRDFLRSVIARRPSDVSSNGTAHDHEAVLAESTPPETAPSDTVTGSIDALFANAAPSDDDRSAANVLAQAFGEWPEPTPIRGVPAHEASSELSLDHVFKANAPMPRREDQDSFSFDQFFSEELGEESSGSEHQPGGASAETSDDIVQFNTWLNGLKKT